MMVVRMLVSQVTFELARDIARNFFVQSTKKEDRGDPKRVTFGATNKDHSSGAWNKKQRTIMQAPKPSAHVGASNFDNRLGFVPTFQS